MSLDIFGPTLAASGISVRPTDTRTPSGTDTFFKDCSSPDLDDGTEFQAAWFNQILANCRSLARGNGQTAGAVDIVTESNADDALLLKAIQHLVQRGQMNFALDTGVANSVVAAFSPPLAEHKLGVTVRVKIAAKNTGPATFTPNGLAAKAIKRLGGSDLLDGDLPANGVVELAYDGAAYQVISSLSGGSSGGSTTKAPKLIGFAASGGGQAVPTTTGVTMGGMALGQNNLWGTSGFTGANGMTVGAGEAGLWLCQAFTWWPAPIGGTNMSVNVTLNGGGTLAFSQQNGGQPGSGAVNQASAVMKLDVGDRIQANMYHQAGTTVSTNTHGLSAYLISAY